MGAEIVGPNRILFRYRKSDSPLPRILEALRSENLTVADVTTDETDLEDIFLQLTSEGGAGGA